MMSTSCTAQTAPWTRQRFNLLSREKASVSSSFLLAHKVCLGGEATHSMRRTLSGDNNEWNENSNFDENFEIFDKRSIRNDINYYGKKHYLKSGKQSYNSNLMRNSKSTSDIRTAKKKNICQLNNNNNIRHNTRLDEKSNNRSTNKDTNDEESTKNEFMKDTRYKTVEFNEMHNNEMGQNTNCKYINNRISTVNAKINDESEVGNIKRFNTMLNQSSKENADWKYDSVYSSYDSIERDTVDTIDTSYNFTKTNVSSSDNNNNNIIINNNNNKSNMSSVWIEEDVCLERLSWSTEVGLKLRFVGGLEPTERVNNIVVERVQQFTMANEIHCTWGRIQPGDLITHVHNVPVQKLTRAQCLQALSALKLRLRLRHFFSLASSDNNSLNEDLINCNEYSTNNDINNYDYCKYKSCSEILDQEDPFDSSHFIESSTKFPRASKKTNELGPRVRSMGCLNHDQNHENWSESTDFGKSDFASKVRFFEQLTQKSSSLSTRTTTRSKTRRRSKSSSSLSSSSFLAKVLDPFERLERRLGVT